ncbi:MAG: dephospho-CoA kinase [Gammaproteobacteria bacterium]
MTQHQPQATGDTERRPLIIGLTGGIGCGKSTVARLFEALGITVVDADRLAHELVSPDQPAFAAIVTAFGEQAVTTDGTLDRAWLRQRIYSNPEDKQKLESILHPRIRARMQALLQAAGGPYCVAVIPLLLESGQTDMVDRVLVVDSPEVLQYRRVAERDDLPEKQIRDIISAQADRATRLAAADDLITNDSDMDALSKQVNTLHAQYLELAHA